MLERGLQSLIEKDSNLRQMSLEIKSHHATQAKHLGNIPVVQAVYEKNIVKKLDENLFIISADRFF